MAIGLGVSAWLASAMRGNPGEARARRRIQSAQRHEETQSQTPSKADVQIQRTAENEPEPRHLDRDVLKSDPSWTTSDADHRKKYPRGGTLGETHDWDENERDTARGMKEDEKKWD